MYIYIMYIYIYTVYTSRATRSGEKRWRYAGHSGPNIQNPLRRKYSADFTKKGLARTQWSVLVQHSKSLPLPKVQHQ